MAARAELGAEQDIIGGAGAQERAQTPPTSVRQWHAIVKRVADQIGPGVRAIAPFGFEVFRDRRFYQRSLRNFYVYLYPPEPSAAPADLAERGADLLLRELASAAPDLLARVHSLRTPRGMQHREAAGDATIYLKVRQFHADPIQDYADALLALPACAHGQYLKALARFEEDAVSRRYFFQLCLIYGAISARLGAAACPAAAEIEDIVRRLAPADVAPDAERFSVSAEERDALNLRCLPWLRQVEEEFAARRGNSGHDIEIRGRNFHGGGELRVTRPATWRRQAGAFVRDCYEWGMQQ